MAKLLLGDLYIYNRSFLQNFGTDELAAEYNRLRKVANKRLEAFSRSEFSESQVYKRNRGKYAKTAKQMSRSELMDAVAAVGHFVGAKTGSVRGMQSARKKAIESLHHPRDPVTGERMVDEDGEPVKGYTFINKENFKLFTQFMEAWRDEHPPKDGSPTAAELQDILKPGSKKLTAEEAKEAFKKYLIEHGYDIDTLE